MRPQRYSDNPDNSGSVGGGGLSGRSDLLVLREEEERCRQLRSHEGPEVLIHSIIIIIPYYCLSILLEH